jgi:hypothetical protein
MRRKNFFYIGLTIVVLIFLGCLLYRDKLEQIPSVVFGAVAIFFSYHAYLFSRERFRLDLFEKRWEVYQRTLEFCSQVIKYGGLPRHSDNEKRNEDIIKALSSAHESFRGIGHHKTRSLFGSEIYNHFEKLNNSYSWLLSFGLKEGGDKAALAKEEGEHLKFIWQTIEQLPNLFKPYLYFGDYKF